MWRFYLLKGYALVIGVGLIVLGMADLLGLTSYFFIPQPAEPAENALHIGTGLLFIGGWWSLDELGSMRAFVGGMGLLQVIGKIVIVGGRTIDLGFFSIHFVGVVCLVVGVCSLLIALFIVRGARV